MASRQLTLYLNRHLDNLVLSGQILDLLENGAPSKAVEELVADLRKDFLLERQSLEALMGRLQATVSSKRRGPTWFSDKITDLKARLENGAARSVHVLEAIEALGVGLEAKRALWTALASTTDRNAKLSEAECRRFEKQSAAQKTRLESLRLEIARMVLGSTSAVEMDAITPSALLQ